MLLMAKMQNILMPQGTMQQAGLSPYCNKIKGNLTVAPLLHYDSSDYYQLPKAREEAVLTEPYFYEGIFMISHVSPIFRDGKFVG